MILIKEMMTNLQIENLPPTPIFSIFFYKLPFNVLNKVVIFEYINFFFCYKWKYNKQTDKEKEPLS